MKLTSILIIVIALVLLPAFFCSAETRNSSGKSDEDYLSEYEAERNQLPKLVYQLFYAVKDSLDYGHIEGEEERSKPKPRLIEYSRVTTELIEAFEKEYQIEKYEPIDDDYVLIVSSKINNREKYKATRTEKFILSNGKWKSLGGYLYF